MSQTHPADTIRSCDPVLQSRGRRWRLLVILGAPAATVATMVAVTGCGGGGSSGSSGYRAPTSSSAPAGGGASREMVKTANVGQLGQVLVDGNGRTVYLFEKDKAGKSSCSGSCAAVWPPVTTGAKPQPGSGVDASKLGTTRRSDGTTEVTYGGHPLYFYAPDGNGSGNAQGQGLNQFGAKWYVLSSSGNAVVQQSGY